MAISLSMVGREAIRLLSRSRRKQSQFSVDIPLPEAALDGLIELSVLNARERIDQLNDYYKARALAHN